MITADDDGDAVDVTYRWFVNDVELLGETSDTLDLSQPGYGDKGDTIRVGATPNDGHVDGATDTDEVMSLTLRRWCSSSARRRLTRGCHPRTSSP